MQSIYPNIEFMYYSQPKSVFQNFRIVADVDVKKCIDDSLVPLVAGALTEREKMYHGGSFLKLADDNMDIQNPEAQNRAMSRF